MTFRFVVAVLPAVLGWGLGVYFHFRALEHRRTNFPVARLTPFLLRPFGEQFYTLEGFRYRGIAMLSAFVGMGLTVVLLVIFNP